jgi:hypothetical protein
MHFLDYVEEGGVRFAGPFGVISGVGDLGRSKFVSVALQ